MPTYALLGATGSTGSAILRCLLAQPPKSLVLNIFVRSEFKLRKLFPDLESTTASKTNIVEGIPSNSTTMRECLKDVDVVMACIGSNESKRGMSVSYDTATAIIDALKSNRETRGYSYKPPTIIQLRSASLNPILSAAMPWIARKMAGFCFHYVYEDLDQACKLFASSAVDSPGLLDYIFIDPPSIHDANGTMPTGYKLILDEKQDGALSYADLGAAFCEVAERRDEFVGKGVGVTATGTVNMTWGALQGYMATGAKSRIWG